MDVSTALQVFVSPLLGTIYDNLSSLIGSQFGLISGVDEELQSLSNTLSTIQDVLEDAEMKQITVKPIRNWLKRLKDVAYEADDILDECRTEAVSKVKSGIVETNERFNSNLALTDYIPSFFGSPNVLARHALGERIKKLRQKFDEIAEQRSKFDLNSNMIVKDVKSEVKLQRETSSFLVEPQVYGRDEEKDYIVSLLLNNTGADPNDAPQEKDVRVCAILGMGGLGKTTLAQMVHNDKRTMNHFELRCWVCVSDNFERKTILKAMIESSGRSAQNLENLLDVLCHRFQQIFGGKRFLVVLDDVWNDDEATWEFLKSLFRFGGRGSSIIVTTRLEGVASLMANLQIFRPKLLSEAHCWSLFKHRAFNKKETHPNLEVIGKAIVKKCGGIPLAAKALGGLLRTKRKEIEWLYVKDSDIWDLPQDKSDAILPALMLSYSHLPIHLRQCFAFCSIFPKGYVIERENLIHLWMANSFVQSKGGNMELEDVGDDIFNELSHRSFFQDFKNDEDGIISSCKMHDLVHDLACSISRDESSSTRHLSLCWSNKVSFPKNSTQLRTFMQLPVLPRPTTSQLRFIFSKAICLRVLDLSVTNLSEVPVSIGNLKHLRYLNLSHTLIESLPNESFCTLINLQMLKLNSCKLLKALPKDIWKMSSLRHLDILGCRSLAGMPIGMGKVTCLQTLSMYVVGAESGYGMITELQRLDHLRGKVEIIGLENVRKLKDARNANLVKQPNLHTLRLFWTRM